MRQDGWFCAALVLFILFIEEMWVCGPVFGNKVLKYQIEKNVVNFKPIFKTIDLNNC